MAFKDVIVVLPGISGSALEKDGREIWGTSRGALWRAVTSGGDSIVNLTLGATDDPTLDDLGDGVKATRLIPDMHLIPGLWKIDGYSGLMARLHTALQLEPGRNLFAFPYDWRRDNRVAAGRLRKQARAWLNSWRESSGNIEARLVLVGHSMGGLVARYFLEVLDGWRDSSALITFGTPYRGSLNAVGYLTNGYAKKIGPLSVDLSATLRSFSSVYQLMPAFKCVDLGDGSLKRVAEAGDLPNIDGMRAVEALKFHREIKEAQEANAGLDQYRTHGYKIHPVVGVQQPTFQSAILRGGELSLLQTFDGADNSGDGTVPRVSAVPFEWGGADRATFVAEAHASLQNWEPTLVQLAGILSGADIDLDLFSFAPKSGLSLDLDDVYPADKVEIRAASAEADAVVAIISDERGTRRQDIALASRGDDAWAATMSLPAGHYRVRVEVPGLPPVTDIFLAV